MPLFPKKITVANVLNYLYFLYFFITLSVFSGYSNTLRRIFQLRIPLLRIGLE
jgi:hypothetical protein